MDQLQATVKKREATIAAANAKLKDIAAQLESGGGGGGGGGAAGDDTAVGTEAPIGVGDRVMVKQTDNVSRGFVQYYGKTDFYEGAAWRPHDRVRDRHQSVGQV